MRGSLGYIYERSVEDFNLYGSKSVRSFIVHALDRVEDSLKSMSKKLIVIRAPPGIGKTAVPLTILLSMLKGYDLGVSSVIHVAPTRSLIDDLAFRLRGSLAKLLGGQLAQEIVARQHGFAHETSNLAAPYTITTFDTYLYNLFKLPTDEIVKIYSGRYGHYEVPRSIILSSLNFLDEAHIVVEEESTMAKALATSIKALVNLGIPTLISTATLPDNLLNTIHKQLQIPEDSVEVIDYEDFIKKKGVDDFYDLESSKKFAAIKNKPLIEVRDACSVDEGEFSEYVKELLQVSESGGRAAIVVNTVETAKCMYSKLKDQGNVILIHSRFTPEDRVAKLEAAKEYTGVLLVTTQVLEVGVDLSFDAMLSQVSPPSSLIQRMGRLARGEFKHEGRWAVFVTREDLDKGSYVYEPEAVRYTWDRLQEIVGKEYTINWHLPRSINGGFKGYMDILGGTWFKGVFNVVPSFYKTLTSPLVHSGIVAEFLRVIGGFRDENICSLYPVDVPIGTMDADSLRQLWKYSIPMPCEQMLNYVEKVIVTGKGQARVLRRDRNSWDTVRVETLDTEYLKRLKSYLRRDPFLFPIEHLGVVIPSDLYDGGVRGVGLKDV